MKEIFMSVTKLYNFVAKNVVMVKYICNSAFFLKIGDIFYA